MKKMIWNRTILLSITFLLLITTIQVPLSSEQETYEYSIILDDISYEFLPIIHQDTFYTQIQISDIGFTQSVGSAKLPVYRYYLQLPMGDQPQVLITQQQWNETSLEKLQVPEILYPTQASQIKTETKNDFYVNTTYYSLEKYQPETWIQISEIGFIRGRRCALLEITPVRYKPLTGELQLLTSIQLQVKVPHAQYAKTFNNLTRFTSPSFSQLSKNLLINYDDFRQQTSFNNDEGYLIITPDYYYSYLLGFKQWKEEQSFTVTIVNTSSIPNGNTTAGISSCIQDAYDNWTIPPSYVLLIGDIDDIPTFQGTTGWPGPADAVDLYYTTVNGTDYFADIFIGRLSVSNENELISIIDKTIFYQQGEFANESWVKNASFLAGNDHYEVTEGSHNYSIDTFLSPRGFISDKIYEETYGATTQDVTDAINDGRGITVFSGHGNPYYWSDGPQFYQYNIQDLTNANEYPVVFSHACDTGQFNYDECFGETWIREDQKGAVAFIGASASTLWSEDDVLERGIFQGWWNENIDCVKGILDYGLYKVYLQYGGGGYSKYYFETYNLLGDPSLMIWRDKPSLYNKPPKITNISIDPLIQEPNGFVNISCMVSDEKIPADVTLHVIYPNASFVNVTMTHSEVDENPENITYYYNTSYTGYGLYQAIISATDVKDISNESDPFNFTIASVYNVTDLHPGWNFISLPVNTTVSKYHLIISYNQTEYDWNSSIEQTIINPTLFGWKRASQSYDFSDELQSGYGYWMYANQECTLIALVQKEHNVTGSFQNQLYSSWNTIGIVNDAIYPKQTISIKWDNSSYSWSDAVNSSLLSTFVFGWNRDTGSYEFVNDFRSGYGYWLYAYEPIILKQSELS